MIALEQLGRLRQQAKGRQVRRLEDQVKSFADVVQSGMATLGCTDIATVLEVIQNRSGYDTLLLFVSCPAVARWGSVERCCLLFFSDTVATAIRSRTDWCRAAWISSRRRRHARLAPSRCW